MRTYIYTPNERRALTAWLKGQAERKDSASLDQVLTRTKSNRAALTRDLQLLTLATKKLHAEGRKRHRSDLEVTIAVAPLTLEAANRETYTLLPTLRRSEETVNYPAAPTDVRLDAFQEVARIAKEIRGTI